MQHTGEALCCSLCLEQLQQRSTQQMPLSCGNPQDTQKFKGTTHTVAREDKPMR